MLKSTILPNGLQIIAIYHR